MVKLNTPMINIVILHISVPFEHCVFHECSVTVAVAASCTGIFAKTFLGLSSTVSVEFHVQEVTTATVTQHHGIHNVQTEVKSAV